RTLHGDFEGAFRVAHATLTRHPTDPSALAAAGEASFNLVRYPEAIRFLQTAHAAAPERPSVGVQLGLALVRADRGREAVTVLKEIVQAASPPPQAWEFLGQAQLSVGETMQADACFARAEAVGAAGGGAAFGRALVALAQGRT